MKFWRPLVIADPASAATVRWPALPTPVMRTWAVWPVTMVRRPRGDTHRLVTGHTAPVQRHLSCLPPSLERWDIEIFYEILRFLRLAIMLPLSDWWRHTPRSQYSQEKLGSGDQRVPSLQWRQQYGALISDHEGAGLLRANGIVILNYLRVRIIVSLWKIFIYMHKSTQL